MKLQLDTNAKTIKVEEDVNISELISKLKKLLPKGEWKEYTLHSNTKIEWYSYPIITYDYIRPWWENPVVTCDTNNLTISSSSNETFSIANLGNVTTNNVTLKHSDENYMGNGIYNIQL